MTSFLFQIYSYFNTSNYYQLSKLHPVSNKDLQLRK